MFDDRPSPPWTTNSADVHDAMTSLEELCQTQDQKEIAKRLAEHEILTDRDLLLEDDAALKRCNIPKLVPDPESAR
jgi:hypothetical protein